MTLFCSRHIRSHILVYFSLLSISFLMIGCYTHFDSHKFPYKAYEGPIRPRAEIATLLALPPAVVSKIDDKEGYSFRDIPFKGFILRGIPRIRIAGLEIDLLPGKHSLVLNYWAGWNRKSIKGGKCSVELDAGKDYEITATTEFTKQSGYTEYFNIQYKIREIQTGEEIPLLKED